MNNFEIDDLKRAVDDGPRKVVIWGSIFAGFFLACAISLQLSHSEYAGIIPMCVANVVMSLSSVATALVAKRRISIAVRCLAAVVLLSFVPTVWAQSITMIGPRAFVFNACTIIGFFACVLLIMQPWLVNLYISRRFK